MHKHIVRLLTLIAVIAVVAISARTFFIQDTFYQYGHYRGASVAQIAAKVPKHQGSASCQPCHKDIYATWASGMHQKATKDNVVQGVVIKSGPGCEVCHTGPAGNHPSKELMPLSTEDQVTTITHTKHETHPANVPGRKLLLTPIEMLNLCASCHEKLPGRPLRGIVAGIGVPQVVIESHGGQEPCTTCHNPHSPRIDFSKLPLGQRGDAKAGKSVAAACFGCHGEAGISVNPAWPNLAGQQADYLVDSIKAFKSGVRKNDLMSPMVAGLNETDIRNVATYFSQTSCRVTGGDKAMAALGKTKAASCAACHSAGGLYGTGSVGRSGAPIWPHLAGQNAEYLSSALKSFQNGSRNHAVMSSVAKTLSASDIDHLAAYYASASCK